jgi:hypothetical protein
VTTRLPLPGKIEKAFNRFWGWGYSLANPQVPEFLPGMPKALASAVAPAGRPASTNCTVLEGWCIFAALPEARAVPGLWLDLQVGRGKERPWSGQEGLVAANLGEWADLEEPGVYSVQSWSNLVDGKIVSDGPTKSSGHRRLVTVVDARTMQVREASQRKGGVVYHQLGLGQEAQWGHAVRAVRLYG